jgi:hypothetical protein
VTVYVVDSGGVVGCHNLGMRETASEESVPFRWDLVTPDRLGSLLDGTVQPSLWFLEELVDCAGKVVARGGNGDLVFVGRSLDSMFDLLSGALADGPTLAPHAGHTPQQEPLTRIYVAARAAAPLGPPRQST